MATIPTEIKLTIDASALDEVLARHRVGTQIINVFAAANEYRQHLVALLDTHQRCVDTEGTDDQKYAWSAAANARNAARRFLATDEDGS